MKPLPSELIETMRRLYLEQRLTQEEIGERFGIKQCTVSYHLRRHHIPTRKPTDYYGHLGRRGYQREVIRRQLEGLR